MLLGAGLLDLSVLPVQVEQAAVVWAVLGEILEGLAHRHGGILGLDAVHGLGVDALGQGHGGVGRVGGLLECGVLDQEAARASPAAWDLGFMDVGCVGVATPSGARGLGCIVGRGVPGPGAVPALFAGSFGSWVYGLQHAAVWVEVS